VLEAPVDMLGCDSATAVAKARTRRLTTTRHLFQFL